MVTVRELAEQLQVSKNAVMKKIDKLNLRGELIKQGNKLLIDTPTADKVIKAFNRSGESVAAEPMEHKDTITADLVAMLQRELDEKNSLIDRLQSQIENLQESNADTLKALREVNTLHAATMQQLQSAEEETEEKGGFFRRLFG